MSALVHAATAAAADGRCDDLATAGAACDPPHTGRQSAHSRSSRRPASASRTAGPRDEEDPADWGFDDDEGDEGVDFKQRIADLTHHAHTAASAASGGVAGSADATWDDEPASADWELASEDIDSIEWERARSRQFSAVGWTEWDDTVGSVGSTTKLPSHHHSRIHLHSTSTSLASTVSASAPVSASPSRWSSISSETGVTSSQQAHEQSHALAHAAASSATCAASSSSVAHAHSHSRHSHHHSASAGFGRNLSLDSSARQLGLNIVYVERLALPLLRSEIHSFFRKLLVRVDALLHGLETAPLTVLTRMLQGMHQNAANTQDEELRKNFNDSAQRMRKQIDEVQAADPNAASSAALSPPSTSPLASPTLSSTSPPTGSLSSLALNGAGAFSPSPARASPGSSSSPFRSPFGSPSPSSLASPPPTPLGVAFVAPSWWPASLVASHATLVRVREAFDMMEAGFDDAKSTTGPTRSAITNHAATMRAPSSSHTASTIAAGSPPSRPPSLLSSPPPSVRSPSSRSLVAPARLAALPTTHSNRDGLKLLARLMQAFSLVVSFEGGQLQQASKLALAFQRMSNTLLEKHQIEETKWAKT